MDLIRNIFKGDRVVWMIFGFLCVISIIEVFSAASTLTYKTGDHWGPMKEHFTMLMVGVVIALIVHNIPYKWFQVFPLFLLPLSGFLLALISVMGVITGDRINGAARWSSVLGVSFQPSELAKMAVIIAVAFILSLKQNDESANTKAFKYIMIITGTICLLIAPENLSTALLLFGVVFVMMIIGHISWKKIGILAGTLFAGLALFIAVMQVIPDEKKDDIPFLHRMDTWKNRILSFTDKEEIPAAKFDIDKDAQVAHARIAMATSGVVGKGPGNSVQRDFLSQAFSDFIFAIIVEELGLFGGIVVVMLYIWLLVRAGRIAQKCKRTFPAYLVMGIALLLVSQALLNMMVAVGLFPVTGQPLPLISKGGTSTLINCAYVGMILSVSRYAASVQEDKPATEITTANPDEFEATEPTAEILNNDAEFETA